MCAGPLFALVSRFAPELQLFCTRCNDNRAVWQTRLDEVTAAEKALDDTTLPFSPIPEPPLPKPPAPSCPDCMAALTVNADAESSRSTPPLLSSGQFTPTFHSTSSSMSSLHSEPQFLMDVPTPNRVRGFSFHLSDTPKLSIPRPSPDSISSDSSPSSYHSAQSSLVDDFMTEEGQQEVEGSSSPAISFPRLPRWATTTGLTTTTTATVSTLGAHPGDIRRSSSRRSAARSAKSLFFDEDSWDGWQFANSVGLTAIRTAYRASARGRVLYGDHPRFRRRSVGLLSWERGAAPSSVH